MPIKVILTESATDLAHDLQQCDGLLRQAIEPNMAAYSCGHPARCWLYESIDLLTDSGIQPRQILTTIFTNRPETDLLPSPLSAAAMRRSQKKIEDIVIAASSLTGHQKLQLCQEIADATENPLPVTPPEARSFADVPATWRQIARGNTITRRLKEELTRFDAALDAYDPSIGAKPVLGLIGALGYQAGLAKHINSLGIHPDDWQSIAWLLSTGDRTFGRAQERCERLIEAHAVVFDKACLLKPNRSECIGSVLTTDIHEILFRELQSDEKVGVFRAHSCGPHIETGLPGLPHAAIREQMRLFTGRFGYKTWPDCHAIVRAGLAILHFLRVRPFDQGNGDVGRLLFSLLLEDRGIPELPLDLVLVRRRTEYNNMLRGAVLEGDTIAFIRFLIEVGLEAMQVGGEIALEVRAEILPLRHAMRSMKTGSVDTNHLAVALCSRLIVADHHVIFACDADPNAAIAVARELALAGLVDEVGVGGQFSWSVPGIRRLICRTQPKQLI